MAIRDALLGPPERRRVHAAALVGLFLIAIPLSTGGMPLAPAGGVVFVPVGASLFGFLAAAALRFDRAGVLTAWAAVLAPVWGVFAEWAFLSLPGHALLDRLEFFLSAPVSPFIVGAVVVFGTLGAVVGEAARRVVEAVREYDV